MELENLLRKEPSTVDPQPGELLIAGPMIGDPHFSRTAVMILDKPENAGHFGLVLNRKSNYMLSEAFDGIEGGENIPLFQGGPVELDRLFMLHNLGDKIDKSIRIADGLYMGGDSDQLLDMIENGILSTENVRFFLGYSGWEENQLTSEILDHTWAINTHPNFNILFKGYGESYWRERVEELGPEYRSWLNVPGHPQLN